jgi:hypothetical protein
MSISGLVWRGSHVVPHYKIERLGHAEKRGLPTALIIKVELPVNVLGLPWA